MTDLEQTQGKRAGAFRNADFVWVGTYSGRGLLGQDPEGACHILPPDASDESLGLAVVDALKHSRFLSMEEAHVYFDRGNSKERYAAWVTSLMERYEYKTKRALFKAMRNCGIHQNADTIIFSPTHHDKLEGWSGEGISEDDLFVIPVNSSPADVGQALRKAFARCT